LAKSSKQEVRLAAVAVIQRLLEGGGSLTRLIPEAQQRVAEGDRSLLQALCYGYARWADQLEGLLTPLLKKPLKNKDQDLVILMQLGILQLRYMRIAEHAAVNTTVKAVVNLKKPWAKGLVNGVLRSYQRQEAQLTEGLSEHTRCSHPQWLLEQLKTDWPWRWKEIADAANKQAPMTLRVNTGTVSTTDYQSQLNDQDMLSDLSDFAPEALILQQAVQVERLPSFASGAVSVQDAAAQLAAHLLASVTSGSLLDACAAPGGKTLHAIELNHWQRIVALDKDKERLKRVQENVDRLNPSSSPELITADANSTAKWWDGEKFDAILLDAPCSGTGVIRRHPDIKLLRRPTDIDDLVTQQATLLANLWPLLKPGGYLLYASCSIIKDENEHQIADFMAAQKDVIHCELDAIWGLQASYGRQILPGQDHMDGFYYALLEKAA
jgi:16S rRNA (cytosine967-C5)-methyltransferase